MGEAGFLKTRKSPEDAQQGLGPGLNTELSQAWGFT